MTDSQNYNIQIDIVRLENSFIATLASAWFAFDIQQRTIHTSRDRISCHALTVTKFMAYAIDRFTKVHSLFFELDSRPAWYVEWGETNATVSLLDEKARLQYTSFCDLLNARLQPLEFASEREEGPLDYRLTATPTPIQPQTEEELRTAIISSSFTPSSPQWWNELLYLYQVYRRVAPKYTIAKLAELIGMDEKHIGKQMRKYK